MRLLLLSNSRSPGREYLEHARDHLREFLGAAPRRLAFVPYAAVTFSWNEYAERVRTALGALGHIVESVHEDDPTDVLRHADGLVVGGGNTFRLLEQLERADLLPRIRARVKDGMPYIGWSAGSNLACPTIGPPTTCPSSSPGPSPRWASCRSRSIRITPMRPRPITGARRGMTGSWNSSP
jgi:dipeptidase E